MDPLLNGLMKVMGIEIILCNNFNSLTKMINDHFSKTKLLWDILSKIKK